MRLFVVAFGATSALVFMFAFVQPAANSLGFRV